MIKTVIRLGNDMVIVFDATGEQVPAYQGHYEDVRDMVVRDAPEGAVFNHWFGRSPAPRPVPIVAW